MSTHDPPGGGGDHGSTSSGSGSHISFTTSFEAGTTAVYPGTSYQSTQRVGDLRNDTWVDGMVREGKTLSGVTLMDQNEPGTACNPHLFTVHHCNPEHIPKINGDGRGRLQGYAIGPPPEDFDSNMFKLEKGQRGVRLKPLDRYEVHADLYSCHELGDGPPLVMKGFRGVPDMAARTRCEGLLTLAKARMPMVYLNILTPEQTHRGTIHAQRHDIETYFYRKSEKRWIRFTGHWTCNKRTQWSLWFDNQGKPAGGTGMTDQNTGETLGGDDGVGYYLIQALRDALARPGYGVMWDHMLNLQEKGFCMNEGMALKDLVFPWIFEVTPGLRQAPVYEEDTQTPPLYLNKMRTIICDWDLGNAMRYLRPMDGHVIGEAEMVAPYPRTMKGDPERVKAHWIDYGIVIKPEEGDFFYGQSDHHGLGNVIQCNPIPAEAYTEERVVPTLNLPLASLLVHHKSAHACTVTHINYEGKQIQPIWLNQALPERDVESNEGGSRADQTQALPAGTGETQKIENSTTCLTQALPDQNDLKLENQTEDVEMRATEGGGGSVCSQTSGGARGSSHGELTTQILQGRQRHMENLGLSETDKIMSGGNNVFWPETALKRKLEPPGESHTEGPSAKANKKQIQSPDRESCATPKTGKAALTAPGESVASNTRGGTQALPAATKLMWGRRSNSTHVRGQTQALPVGESNSLGSGEPQPKRNAAPNRPKQGIPKKAPPKAKVQPKVIPPAPMASPAKSISSSGSTASKAANSMQQQVDYYKTLKVEDLANLLVSRERVANANLASLRKLEKAQKGWELDQQALSQQLDQQTASCAAMRADADRKKETSEVQVRTIAKLEHEKQNLTRQTQALQQIQTHTVEGDKTNGTQSRLAGTLNDTLEEVRCLKTELDEQKKAIRKQDLSIENLRNSSKSLMGEKDNATYDLSCAQDRIELFKTQQTEIDGAKNGIQKMQGRITELEQQKAQIEEGRDILQKARTDHEDEAWENTMDWQRDLEAVEKEKKALQERLDAAETLHLAKVHELTLKLGAIEQERDEAASERTDAEQRCLKAETALLQQAEKHKATVQMLTGKITDNKEGPCTHR